MAPNAHALLPAPHPEKSRLALQGFAGGVEQFDLQRLLGWYMKEERPVRLDWRGAKQFRITGGVARVQARGTN